MTTKIADIEQDDSKTRAQVIAIGAGQGDHIFRTSDTNEWLFLHNDGSVSELGGGNASGVSTDTTGFDGNLSSADDNVQKALDTLDDMDISDATSIQGVEAEPIPDGIDGNNLSYVSKWLQNLIVSSEAISQVWNRYLDIGNDPRIYIADSTMGFHRITQTVSVSKDGEHTLYLKLDIGNTPFLFVQLYNATIGSKFFYVNTATGEISNISSGVTGSASVEGSVLVCRLEVDAQNVDLICFVGASAAAGSTDFTGDDVSTTFEVLETQICEGTIADNLDYIETTDTAELGTTKLVPVSAPEQGLKKVNVATGALEIPVDDTEYYNGYVNGAMSYYKQTVAPILTAASTVIDAGFDTNNYQLHSYRIWAQSDIVPTNRYAIPRPSSPTLEVPEVNGFDLVITRTGTGVYPDWSYVGGYTYFKIDE